MGTEFEARKHHYYILLTTVKKTFKINESVPRFLLEKNVDGVILAGKVPAKLIDYIQKLDLPLVLVDYLVPNCRTSRVLIDNYQGIRLGVKHLYKDGHRKIAFAGGEINHPSIRTRLRSYEEAIQECGLPRSDELISCAEPYTCVNDGYEATRKLLDSGVQFTAIVASNDTMAVGAIRCLRERELRVPEDVSIIGFDDIEVCLQVEPHLTTIRVAKEELGAIAVRRIVEMIVSQQKMLNEVTVPVELIIRESTGQAPGNG